MSDWLLSHPRLVAFIVGAIGFALLSVAVPDWRLIAGLILLFMAERIRDGWRF